jgi:hypothetical protein
MRQAPGASGCRPSHSGSDRRRGDTGAAPRRVDRPLLAGRFEGCGCRPRRTVPASAPQRHPQVVPTRSGRGSRQRIPRGPGPTMKLADADSTLAHVLHHVRPHDLRHQPRGIDRSSSRASARRPVRHPMVGLVVELDRACNQRRGEVGRTGESGGHASNEGASCLQRQWRLMTFLICSRRTDLCPQAACRGSVRNGTVARRSIRPLHE